MCVLCQRLDDCASISGFDADSNWIGHIFKTEPLTLGVFVDYVQRVKGMLTLHVHAVHAPGENLLLQIACSLGVTIVYQYTDEDGDAFYRKYTPDMVCDASNISLRTEESLDVDIKEEDAMETQATPVESVWPGEVSYGPSSGLSSMNLFSRRESAKSADAVSSSSREGAAFYARYKEIIILLTKCGQSFDELPTVRDLVCYMTQNLVDDLIAWCEGSGKSGIIPYDNWATLISSSVSLRGAAEHIPNRLPHYESLRWSVVTSSLESIVTLSSKIFPELLNEFNNTRVPN